MYVELQHEKKEQLFYHRIIICTTQAWKREGVMLQDLPNISLCIIFLI